MTSKATSVLLVDDHAVLRETLGKRIGAEMDLTVVGHAANATEALSLVATLKPDVVLMDIDMPGVSAFEAAEKMTASGAGCAVVFLSAHFHDRYIENALSVHALGYVVKDESQEVVIEAIRSAASGMPYFSPSVRSRLVITANGPRTAYPAKTVGSQLTEREVEILRFVAQGLSKKEIGERLDISHKTVDNHCANLMRKLDIHDRVELARYAIREGLADM